MVNTLFRHAEAAHAEDMSLRLHERHDDNIDDDPAVLYAFMQWWINDLAVRFGWQLLGVDWDAFAKDCLERPREHIAFFQLEENIAAEKVVPAVQKAWGVEGDVSVARQFVLALPLHRRLWGSANPAQLDKDSPIDAMRAAVESWIKCSVHNAWLVAAEKEEEEAQ